MYQDKRQTTASKAIVIKNYLRKIVNNQSATGGQDVVFALFATRKHRLLRLVYKVSIGGVQPATRD